MLRLMTQSGKECFVDAYSVSSIRRCFKIIDNSYGSVITLKDGSEIVVKEELMVLNRKLKAERVSCFIGLSRIAAIVPWDICFTLQGSKTLLTSGGYIASRNKPREVYEEIMEQPLRKDDKWRCGLEF